MKPRRVIGVLSGCLGIAFAVGASYTRAQTPAASGRPASEVVAKVNLAEAGMPAEPV